ncbi:MAG: AMP-binding protein [Pyrinomonadaceae bacterium]
MILDDFLSHHPEFEFDLEDHVRATIQRDYLVQRWVDFTANSTPLTRDRIMQFYWHEFSPGVEKYRGLAGSSDWQAIPYISKSDIRACRGAFLNSSYGGMRWQKWTGGTTGNPIAIDYDDIFYFEQLYLGLRKIAHRYGIDETALGRVYSTTLLTTQFGTGRTVFVNPLGATGLMTRVTIDERDQFQTADTWRTVCELSPVILAAKPTLLSTLLKHQVKGVLESLKLIISSGAFLSPTLRKSVREYFGVPIVNAYALSEFGLVASECQFGSMHIDDMCVVAEVAAYGNAPSVDEGYGELVLSSASNTAMPLLRYRTGDFAVLARGGCACGSRNTIIQALYGRQIPLFQFPNGTIFDPSRLDRILFKFAWVKDYLIVQTDEVTVSTLVQFWLDKEREEHLRIVSREVRAALPYPARIRVEHVPSEAAFTGQRHTDKERSLTVPYDTRPEPKNRFSA